jgi:hypothetical protein
LLVCLVDGAAELSDVQILRAANFIVKTKADARYEPSRPGIIL